MNYLDGKLIQRLESRRTHVEWQRFLKQIDRETTDGLSIHIIADSYGTHKHAKARAWLARHPRIVIHFTSASSSWLNMVERFFAELTTVVRDQSYSSVSQLKRAIQRHLAEHNADPKPFRWVAKGEDILAKIKRASARLAECQGTSVQPT